MNSPLKIRQARPDEAAALSAIAFESKAHWQYSAAQLAAWRDELTLSSSQIATLPTWVAQVEAEIAGFFVLIPAPGQWRLEHLWILPRHMRRGIGRALLKHAAHLAAEGGATALTIDSDPYAEPFYRACGAERVGTVAAPIDRDPGRKRPQMLLPLERREPTPEPTPGGAARPNRK